jgi:hypothetical protein
MYFVERRFADMSSQSVAPAVSGETAPASTSTQLQEGVPRERVDPALLRIVEQLFPGHHGLDFLARLLRHAEAKQLALPDLGLSEAVDVAVITTRSLRALAAQIGLCYDTTEKYIVVFCQLRLLSKQREQQLTLHFPLSPPQLSEPEALDHLQELRPRSTTPRYRPKVRSFASAVKRRFILLRQRGEIKLVGSSKREKASPFLPGETPRLLLEDIRQIIQQEVDSEAGSRLLLKIEGAFRYRCTRTESRLPAPEGDSDEGYGRAVAPAYRKESPFEGREVDSEPGIAHQKSRLSSKKGDSFTPAISSKRRLREAKGDSETHTPIQPPPRPEQKGDSNPSQVAQNGRLSAANERTERKKDDSECHVAEMGFPNVNVITVIESLNVNVKAVGRFCCAILGEAPGKLGTYYRLFEDVERDVQAITAALLFTLMVKYSPGARLDRPAGLFNQRCKDYHVQGIPQEAAVLVEQYGKLTAQELLKALQQLPTGKPAPRSPEKQAGRPRPSHATVTLALARPPQGLRGMTRASYQQVARLIKEGANTTHMRCVAYRQGDGSYLALVEDWLGRQRWIHSLQEWQQVASSIARSIWPSETRSARSSVTRVPGHAREDSVQQPSSHSGRKEGA